MEVRSKRLEKTLQRLKLVNEVSFFTLLSSLFTSFSYLCGIKCKWHDA